MSLDVERWSHTSASGNGGRSARRAMIRWGWRLLRREWRQQLLVLGLVTVAVGAIFLGSAISVNNPTPANTGFGSAQDLASFAAPDHQLAAQIALLEHRFGRVDVIEDQRQNVPGSVDTYEIRAQNPSGPYGQSLLSLVSGRFPRGTHQVALTSGLAAVLRLRIGSTWTVGGQVRKVVGIVSDPENLLENFALVAPGQVLSPTHVTVLFDADGRKLGSIGKYVQTPASIASSNSFNPVTITLALATIGMLLIALVAIGGFTVLAQRRMRSIGMVESIGATDANVKLVVLANGIAVGVVGAVVGFLVGLVIWLFYRPTLESSSGHVIGVFQLPWVVIFPAMALAVVATFFASSRPARAVTKVPIVAALSGRPSAPKRIRRSAIPGIALLIAAFFLLGVVGSTVSSGGGSTPELVLGVVALIVGLILIAPVFLGLLPRIVRRAPVSLRLALRDLSRYRSRSGSALGAISVGVLISVLVCVFAAARYGNVLDWAGPNLASNQMIVYPPSGPNGPTFTAGQLPSLSKTVDSIAGSLGSRDVLELETDSVGINHTGPGRNWDGVIYVATPQLLRAFGISPSQIDPSADILSARPGLSGTSHLQMTWQVNTTKQRASGQGPANGASQTCRPKFGCLPNPNIQEVSQLPSGTSAPNTLVTEHAVKTYPLGQITLWGWLIQTPRPPTASQIYDARQAAQAVGMTIETRNSLPSSATVLNSATIAGVALALVILAMSIGLIRSETAGDLRTLSATGAGSFTRRNLTAATAGTLALLGALVGTAGAYIGAIAFSRTNALDGLSSLGSVPVGNLLVILVGMPAVATFVAWILAGRQPAAIAHQPIE